MDDRTYTAAAERMSHLQRLQDELARLQQQHADTVAQWQLCHEALTTAERERDALRAELLGVTNARDFLRASLHTERTMHAAELDKHRRELVALRDERPRLLAANVRLFNDNNQLRAELDAMRQAHSVIAARMAAMGC